MRGIGTMMAAAGALALAGCTVQPPQGPSFAAMPGNGKTYDQFRADDARCRQIALQSNGNVSSAQASTQSAIGTAAIGTALGAAAGALIGSATGQVGAGAAIGAGSGLLAGSAFGAGNAQASGASMQRNYDITYAQCMAAAGEAVPQVGGPAYGYAYPAYAPAYAYTYAPAYPPPVVVGVGFGGGWYGGSRGYWGGYHGGAPYWNNYGHWH